jgi:hypothetical protein
MYEKQKAFCVLLQSHGGIVQYFYGAVDDGHLSLTGFLFYTTLSNAIVAAVYIVGIMAFFPVLNYLLYWFDKKKVNSTLSISPH